MLKILSFLSIILALGLAACNLPITPTAATATAPPTIPATLATDTPTPYPTATVVPVGSPSNPIILALPPSITPEQLQQGESLAAGLVELTGYTIVVVKPDSFTDLVADFGKGNAHMAWLPPFAYADAYKKGYVQAGMATQRFGTYYYGAQFIANIRNNFTLHFDSVAGENTTTDPAVALKQFEGRKPCWDDPYSAAGYIIPLGYLNEGGVTTQPAGFVEGHSTVVRSVFAEGICDFGATIIDARQIPSIQQDFPDVNNRVLVVWRIEPIIPYDVVAFATGVPAEMRITLTNALLQLMQTAEGKAAMQNLYKIEDLKPVDDNFYADFMRYLEASALDVSSLVK